MNSTKKNLIVIIVLCTLFSNIFAQITFIPSAIWVNKESQSVDVNINYNCGDLGQIYDGYDENRCLWAGFNTPKINVFNACTKTVTVEINYNSTGLNRIGNVGLTCCSNCLKDCKQ